MDDPRQPARGALTCRELVAFLDAYLAAELPPGRVELFERHLAACPDCRAYLESYRSAIELGRAALTGESSEVPDGLVDSILAALGR
jgi:anti-sigma factor RsiW